MTQEAPEARFTDLFPRLYKQLAFAEENQGSYQLGRVLQGHSFCELSPILGGFSVMQLLLSHS